MVLTAIASSLPRISGYILTEQLYDGEYTAVYRATRCADTKVSTLSPVACQPVIIKVLQQEYPSFSDLVQLRNQYSITHDLSIPGIVRPIALEPWQNGYALVMEDFGGVSLKQYAQVQPLTVATCLQIAHKLAGILNDLNIHHIVHKDIKPANILIRPDTGQIELIDFSIASRLLKETQTLQNPNVLEGTLAYLSPEQTGRMNRGIDYRADFYTLGITLYELLTQTLPFESNDPLELVHCHIAKTAKPPHQVNLAVPPIVSAIVAKLMAKNAENRYQSARGLQHDLEICLSQWEKAGEIVPFELCTRDLCDRFLISEKLYGREAEVETLLAAFERVAAAKVDGHNVTASSGNNSEMMMVAGFSGIGKTAVVNEVHKPIPRQQGYFIKGKFDQLNRNLPLSAFLQVLQDLTEQLLSESEAAIADWRSKILAAVGDSGQVLIDVVPTLERIIGPQQPAFTLSGSATQNRFNRLIQQFIAVFTSPQQPLVIFIDDLQWADLASLQLIKSLMTEQHHLLLLGAYRDNEVSLAHPFMLTVADLKKAGATVNTLTLGPLSAADINCLVADTLHCSAERSGPLTELIIQKTQGNPFFTTQFLKSLHEDGHIWFNAQQSHWECDIAQVNSLASTNNVVEFMAQQLQKLPEKTQQVLQLAACIGNRFDLETLAIAADHSKADIANTLWCALQEGLIIPQGDVYKFYVGEHDVLQNDTLQNASAEENNNIAIYRFLHDRVQQAAYMLISEENKQSSHLKIGQRLLDHATENEREKNLFEIVNHLNIGVALIAESTQLNSLCQLNLRAGQKAKASTAYTSANQYLTAGISLLRPDCWQNQYSLALNLYESAAETALLCGDFEQMEQWAEIVLSNAATLLDQVKIYELKIQAGTSQNQLLAAIAIASKALNQFGVTFPTQPNPNDIQQAFQATNKLLASRDISALADLPEMTSIEQLAVMRLTASIIPAAFIGLPSLFPLIILSQVRASIEHGNAPMSAYSYAAYGLLCNIILNDIAAADQFGQLALDLSFDLHSKELKTRVYFVVGTFIKHHTDSLGESLALLRQSYQMALECGDLESVGYAASHICHDAYLMGNELTGLETSISAYNQVLANFNQRIALNYGKMCQQAVLNLIHACPDPYLLKGEGFDEETVLPQMLAASDQTGLYQFYTHKLILSYLFGALPQAQEYAILSRQYLSGGNGFSITPLFYCYDSLVALQAHSIEENSAELAQVEARVNANQTKLKHWADHAPMNYQHKFDLVEAERCRVAKDPYRAMVLYDQALAGATAHSYPQEAALANELAARFYLAWGKAKIAAGYLQEAYYSYARWGAKAKVIHLEQHYPQLVGFATAEAPSITTIAQKTVQATTLNTVTSATTRKSHWLDFSATLKAAQAISTEIEFDKLLATLMKIVVASAGAQTGYLILQQGKEWLVRAQTHLEAVETVEIPIEQTTNLPQSLIYSVAKTNKAAIFENLSTCGQFESDRYIMLQRPISALCMPISLQSKLVGILYLENNLMEGAFTCDRIETLQFLTSQAAISIENARLYQETEKYSHSLEVEVAKKTLALNQKVNDLETTLKKLKETQARLIQSEKMSSLGQLVAGIAHEINNPINFIYANIKHIGNYNQDLISLINAYQQDTEPPISVQALLKDIDLEFLVEDSTNLLNSLRNGSDRIKQIVLSLRNFSRHDESESKRVNIHEGIKSTLDILHHRFQATPNRAEISLICDYSNLPLVECQPGALNQVIMSLLNNAIDALKDHPVKDKIIRIWTKSIDDDHVAIHVADNGSGISEEVQSRIFDPFFTTKPVGRGTGLGLSTSYQIVTENHNGTLSCHSAVGEGAEFIIELPVKARGSSMTEGLAYTPVGVEHSRSTKNSTVC